MSTPAEKPIRIQRRRTKGYKLPPNTISVTRPGPFGNPFVVGKDADTAKEVCDLFRRVMRLAIDGHDFGDNEDGQHCARMAQRLPELRGKNLACFCKLGDPCHADVLLEILQKG